MTLSAVFCKNLAGFSLDVQVSVPEGITIVFGASGAGKTTFLRCLAGLTRPDSGRIALDGRTYFDSRRSIDTPVSQRSIGYVFQDLALFPHLTAAQNIHYGLAHLDGSSKQERTSEIVESFRIAHLLRRRPTEISGGERQRVALARSLVTNPSLLLLDEPLSALDHLTQSRIIADLRLWNATRGIPILYVTHAHREVFALGERVVVLDAGKVLAQGSPQDVLHEPAQESVAQLAGFENFFDATVVSARVDAGTMHCRITGSDTEIEVPLAAAAPGSIVRIAIRAGDILLATEEPRSLSARNVLPGRITSLRRQGATAIADVDAGKNFEVHLTPSACESLRLAAGRHVWLVIKTHSCRLVE